MSFTVDLAAVMGEVNIALDFQSIKWYGLYIIKAAYVFLYHTPTTIKFKLSTLRQIKLIAIFWIPNALCEYDFLVGSQFHSRMAHRPVNKPAHDSR